MERNGYREGEGEGGGTGGRGNGRGEGRGEGREGGMEGGAITRDIRMERFHNTLRSVYGSSGSVTTCEVISAQNY
jgi:hypothetical protein